MTGPDFDNLLDSLEFVSAAPPGENEAYLCLATGEIHWHSDIGDNSESLPDDVDDAEKYIAIPHQNDLDLGKRLVLEFCREVLPSALPEVEEIFQRKGAYGRFRNLLERRGLVDQWHDFEAKRQKEALRQWCRDNGIETRGAGA